MKKILLFFIVVVMSQSAISAQSVAREWNEVLLEAIRSDQARPTVHARNLFHTSAAMYDAWAAYDTIAEPYFLGKNVHGFECPFNGVPAMVDIEEAREEAISYAAYRLLSHRFQSSPGAFISQYRFNLLMTNLGYDQDFVDTDYSTGNPAALGNYIAEQIIAYGLQDGSNEEEDYANTAYEPVNPSLVLAFEENDPIVDYNRWQPLTLTVFIDQSGNQYPGNTPPFLSPEWGAVKPFAMTNDQMTSFERDGFDYMVYHDPGAPPTLDIENGGAMSEAYQWGFSLVSVWGAHMSPDDGVMWDISPASLGNMDVSQYPTNIEELPDFYDLANGGDPSEGHDLNPYTGMPYEPNVVARGDYARILAEFWADGPDSETPPGHWFTLLNHVNDHAALEKKFRGQGETLGDLEWDLKSYLALGGAMHDAAVTAWGIKGWYDYVRPVSAIRAMAELGQSTDPNLPSYHIGGLPLVDGFIEIVQAGDPLQGFGQADVGKIKVYSWRGPDYIQDEETDVAGVGWILAEDWWPYQRPTFVTPNFAGYVSGHSTFSRAAAEVLTAMTGDPFFPGGMGEFLAPMNQFLVFEEGPSESITLQWATYRDASDQCSLSRIWGGIHPPVDDIPGRLAGIVIGTDAIDFAESYFYRDFDEDGFLNYLDCDDNDPLQFPGQIWYADMDGDGYSSGVTQETCARETGFVLAEELISMEQDCNDNEASINPASIEVCDEIDNNCDSNIDEGVQTSFYADTDEDGFGDPASLLLACAAPMGYITDNTDCNDGDNNEFPDQVWYADMDGDGYSSGVMETNCSRPANFYIQSELISMEADCDDNNSAINPAAIEVCDEVDNNCDGEIDEGVQLSYYADTDEDGFGDPAELLLACALPATGYVEDNTDCNDADANEFPGQIWYEDLDNDSYSTGETLIACLRPNSYRLESELAGMEEDCDDNSDNSFPGATEIPDNGIDEDCSGIDLFLETKIYPNPFTDELTVHFNISGEIEIYIYSSTGQLARKTYADVADNFFTIDLSNLARGVYVLDVVSAQGTQLVTQKIIKM